MKPVLVPTTDVNSETGLLLAWHAGDRSEVRAGETIAEIETSKAIFEVAAPEGGFLLHTAAGLPRIALFGAAFGAMQVIDILHAAGSGTAVAVADRSPAIADHCRAFAERQSWSSRTDTFASVIGLSLSSQDCPDPSLAGPQP